MTDENSFSMVALDDFESDGDSGGGDDEESTDLDGGCFLYKEKKCHRGRGVKDRCQLISKHFRCSPTCRSYARKTLTETNRNSLFETIYLCPTSTAFAAPSTTIDDDRSFTRIIVPSEMPCGDEDSGSGSGCESEYSPPSSIFSISPSLSTVTISQVSSTSSNDNGFVSSYHGTIRESVFLSPVPSSTPPALFPSTATPTLLEESIVSSISPSSTLPTTGECLHKS